MASVSQNAAQNGKTLVSGTGTYRDGLVAPTKDTRYKTEDVTDTKGREFEDFFLKRELLMGIFEKGFERPSPIQEEAIPIILQDRNVLARAKNGTGKTAAFIIPCLEKTNPEQKNIQGQFVHSRWICSNSRSLISHFFFLFPKSAHSHPHTRTCTADIGNCQRNGETYGYPMYGNHWWNVTQG